VCMGGSCLDCGSSVHEHLPLIGIQQRKKCCECTLPVEKCGGHLLEAVSRDKWTRDPSPGLGRNER
jgi:hypothetical protein